ncbi:nucleoside/nucleotide kinase family protein [Actinomarinicola tropica]|uniref:Uridine kinase n=1 Tax=Actinomarinicola tropica TaxID=2789776 RepID=A0A5Q2RKZ0_9ACTN|nr:uridine kinase [Actinomarinicola tropica]QGG93855.1 uridine kinase [Actinomarinicola tropica]
MPAGLDGYPDPIVTPEREVVLAHVVGRIEECAAARVVVGIDGASGAGKSTFADEVAARLRQRGHVVVRSTTDSFHRPRVERMRRGPTSPVGYYLDSHDLGAIQEELLTPFATGRTSVRIAAFDEPSDAPVEVTVDDVAERAVLVFDGLFLLRPELASRWRLVVHLTADRRRAAAWDAYLHDGLPADQTAREHERAQRLERARWPRYQDGWRLYVDEASPLERAEIVVDNDDLAAPRVVRSA